MANTDAIQSPKPADDNEQVEKENVKIHSVFQASRWSTKWTQPFVLEKGTKPFMHAVYF